MLNISRFNYWIAFIITIFSLFVTISIFLSNKISVIDNILPNYKINLGLDLQGGSQLLLELEIDKFLDEKKQILLEEVRHKLREKLIGYLHLKIYKDGVTFDLLKDNQNNDIKIKTLKSLFNNNFEFSENKGHIYIVFSKQYVNKLIIQMIEQTITIVRKRIDETGTKEPIIQRQGSNRILLQVPGVKDPDNLKEILGKTAKLTFHLVNPETPIVADPNIFIPNGMMLLPSQSNSYSEEVGIKYYMVKKKVEVGGNMLVSAVANFNSMGVPVVNFKFNSMGAKKFGDITLLNQGKMMAIVLDNKVISAPVISEPILSGSGIISGDFSMHSANNLAILLRAGALPIPLTIIEERTVGPSLGLDSIRQGKIAIIIGFILVMCFMIIMYKLSGLFAVIALITNVLFLLTLLSIFGATLTLPGIAGIVLTFGMSVDANVLVFERIKEEIRLNQSVYASIDNGFRKAFKTILDSNITTLLVAIILFIFGAGSIKGFALTLSLGIICSMYSAIMITRMLLLFWVRTTNAKKIFI